SGRVHIFAPGFFAGSRPQFWGCARRRWFRRMRSLGRQSASVLTATYARLVTNFVGPLPHFFRDNALQIAQEIARSERFTWPMFSPQSFLCYFPSCGIWSKQR